MFQEIGLQELYGERADAKPEEWMRQRPRYAIKDLEPNYTLRAAIDELTRTQHKPLAQVRMYFLANDLCAYRSCLVE